jgi:hypothetical protein
MGAGSISYRDFAQQIDLVAGGFSATPSLHIELTSIIFDYFVFVLFVFFVLDY